MAKRNGTTSRKKDTARSAAPAIPARTDAPSPANLALELRPLGDGGAEVVVAYEGPLASSESVLARYGTWRSGGAPWAEVQDLHLTRERPGRHVGALRVAAGAPLEALELAFRAGDAWDNGGRAPLGYYEWSVHERQLVVR
jgi:hypothetical protein